MTNDRHNSRMTLSGWISFSPGFGVGVGWFSVHRYPVRWHYLVCVLNNAKKKKTLKLEPIKCITKLSADLVSFNFETMLWHQNWWLSDSQRSRRLMRYPSPRGSCSSCWSHGVPRWRLPEVFLSFLLTQLPVFTTDSSCCLCLPISIIASAFPSVT